MADTQTYERDPKLLDRKAVLEVYAQIINPSLTEEWRKALVDEIFDHVDAQGRLLARAGNALVQAGGSLETNLLKEIRRAMS